MKKRYRHAALWQFIGTALDQKRRIILLYVLTSEGSSPGRKGFCMAIDEEGDFEGTIGGGIMEVKLLELAKDRLKKKKPGVLIKQQYHNKQVKAEQSGLICSGKQIVALISLSAKDRPWLRRIENGEEVKLAIRKEGVLVVGNEEEKLSRLEESNNFYFELPLSAQRSIHIFGGGHVGLALSKVMSLQEYKVIIYDDRPELNTLVQNTFADEIRILDYGRVGEEVKFGEKDAVVIITSSYRTDKRLLRQLYFKPFAYIGMMGSDAKIATLYQELAEEGVSKKALEHVFAPIGLEIYSKTTIEIAISIAGQIIREMNKDLPTGRGY